MKKLTAVSLMLILTLGLLPAGAAAEEGDGTVDLIAGQHMDVGEIQVRNDDGWLYVTYRVDVEGWCLTETHLHVATSLEEIPQSGSQKKGKGRGNGSSGGNPIPGQFDYQAVHDPCVLEYEYQVPLDSLEPPEGESEYDSELYIATHAVVVSGDSFESGGETAWGEGERFVEKGGWGMYFKYDFWQAPPS
jgi:hypothetical protein